MGRTERLNFAENMRPLVSVVMPSYNSEKYISEAIQSVIAQTYENWELLIIDDGSTDSTANIVKQFSDVDSRITLYSNSKNIGVALTRNKGMDLAKGSWIALLDSDDVWHKDKLEKQLELAQHGDILYCSYALMDEDGRYLSDFLVPEMTSYDAMLRESVLSCSTVLLRRQILDGHRFSAAYYHEDYVFWLELLKAGYKAVASRDILVEYRIVKGSRSNNKLKSAKNRWLIYRKTEMLSIPKAVNAFVAYAIHGMVKHRRIR